MVKKSKELKSEVRTRMRDGEGSVALTHFASAEELYQKGRLFGNIHLEPGCSIGYHVHEKDSELFYILSGSALYNDNGTEVRVSAGDVTIAAAGEGHSICNDGTEPMDLVALIVYA